MSGLKGWMGEERAQATVEMAIVAPVLIVLALVAYNAMMFASAVARFDRVAPDVVLAHAVSPVGDGGADAARTVVPAQDKESARRGERRGAGSRAVLHDRRPWDGDAGPFLGPRPLVPVRGERGVRHRRDPREAGQVYGPVDEPGHRVAEPAPPRHQRTAPMSYTWSTCPAHPEP